HGESTMPPPQWVMWQESVHVLVRAIVTTLEHSRPPAVLADPQALRTAIDACLLAANSIGGDRERRGVALLLHRIHEDAIAMANQVLTQPIGLREPRLHARARILAGELSRRINDPNIRRELDEGLATSPQSPQYVTRDQ